MYALIQIKIFIIVKNCFFIFDIKNDVCMAIFII